MTGGAESCINLEKKVRVNIVNFAAGKKNTSYNVIIIIATLGALFLCQHCTGSLESRKGPKGIELISVSTFCVSVILLHTLLISLNLITTLPGRWW